MRYGQRHGFRTAGDAQLERNMDDMGFDGGRADYQLFGDLRVILSFDHQSQHSPLALRQILAWGGRLVSNMDQRLGNLWREGGAPRVRSVFGLQIAYLTYNSGAFKPPCRDFHQIGVQQLLLQ